MGVGQGLRAGLPCCGREAEWGASPAGEELGNRARSGGGRGQERGARAAGAEGGGARSSAGSWRRPGCSPQGCGAPAALAGTSRRGPGKRGSSGRRSLAGLRIAGRVPMGHLASRLCAPLRPEKAHGKTVPKDHRGPKGASRIVVQSPGSWGGPRDPPGEAAGPWKSVLRVPRSGKNPTGQECPPPQARGETSPPGGPGDGLGKWGALYRPGQG